VKRDGANAVITYTKNPFVPSFVYKALLKGAVSLLYKANAQINYSLATSYLLGKSHLEKGAVINGYIMPFGITLPLYVFVFKKRDLNKQIPTYVIQFNFQNRIFSLPMLFDNLGEPNHSNYTIIIPPPYFFTEQHLSAASPVSIQRDLASNEKVAGEEEELTVAMNPENQKDIWAYNRETGLSEQKEFHPSDMKYMIITADPGAIDPKELSDFIALVMNENAK
jgi:hypothetical protein